MNDPEDIEILAAAEHESWSGWMRWMLKEIKEDIGESWVRPGMKDALNLLMSHQGIACFRRWKRQAETPYAGLSEKEKESDRIEARKKLKVYRP